MTSLDRPAAIASPPTVHAHLCGMSLEKLSRAPARSSKARRVDETGACPHIIGEKLSSLSELQHKICYPSRLLQTTCLGPPTLTAANFSTKRLALSYLLCSLPLVCS
jgi:hypothetical protein